MLALTLLALAPCRRAFYRKTALLTERFSSGWLLAVAAVLLGMLWLGFFSHRHVEYSNDLWWRFVAEEDAPRFLRAAAGTLILFLMVGAAQLLRASRRPALAPHPGDVARARAAIAATPTRRWSPTCPARRQALPVQRYGRSFIMFGVRGGSWIALGEPVGPAEERLEILWQFRELCDRHGAWPAFYHITPESLPQFLELGLTFQKLGEEGVVPSTVLDRGPEDRSLRYTLRHLRRDGCRFEIVPVEDVPGILDTLGEISAEWLASKNVREKGFSLGRFERDYMRNFPIAVVRVGERIVAFANVWAGGSRRELSVDLMRHVNAPNSIMEYLFLELMLWGKEQKYERFTSAWCRCSGWSAGGWRRCGARPAPPVPLRRAFLQLPGSVALQGEVRAGLGAPLPGGAGGFALPRVLRDVTLLISGGVSGLVAK